MSISPNEVALIQIEPIQQAPYAGLKSCLQIYISYERELIEDNVYYPVYYYLDLFGNGTSLMPSI